MALTFGGDDMSHQEAVSHCGSEIMLVYYRDFSIVFEKTCGGHPICHIYSGYRCDGNPGILQVSNFLTTVFGAMDYIDQRWYKTENRQSVLEEFASS